MSKHWLSRKLLSVATLNEILIICPRQSERATTTSLKSNSSKKRRRWYRVNMLKVIGQFLVDAFVMTYGQYPPNFTISHLDL